MPSFLFLVTCLMAFATGPVIGSPSGSHDAKSNGDIHDAGVVTKNGATKPRKDMLSTSSFKLCKTAPNCKIYDHPQLGKSISFVVGMERGSEHYNATVVGQEEKRAKEGDGTSLERGETERITQTLTQAGYTTIAVRDRNWWEGGSAPEQLNIRFTAIGQYDGMNSRDTFIESIKTMSEKNQSWTNQHWFRDQWEIRHRNLFGINRYSPEGYTKGYMPVTVSADWGDSANWGGDRAKDFVKDAIGAISPWGGAFFGLLIEGCK